MVGHNSPPPLAGLGREADQGWGEGFSRHDAWGLLNPSPRPPSHPKGRGRIDR